MTKINEELNNKNDIGKFNLSSVWIKSCAKIEELKKSEQKIDYVEKDFVKIEDELSNFFETIKSKSYSLFEVKELINPILNSDVLKSYRRKYCNSMKIVVDDKPNLKDPKIFGDNIKRLDDEILPTLAIMEHLCPQEELCSMKYCDEEYDVLLNIEQTNWKLELTRAVKDGKQECFEKNALRQDGFAFSNQTRSIDKKNKKLVQDPHPLANSIPELSDLPVAGVDLDKEHFPQLLLEALRNKEEKHTQYDWLAITISLPAEQHDCFDEICKNFGNIVNVSSEKHFQRIFIVLEGNYGVNDNSINKLIGVSQFKLTETLPSKLKSYLPTPEDLSKLKIHAESNEEEPE